MTRSSMNKLYIPYKDPEREFRSSKKHFESLSLDELRSPDFNLLSDKEYSEEEEEEAMAETMEQYMSKTRTDYGSGVARPKTDNKDQFELKGQFLKELRENTFSGSDNEDANEHIEKVLEIVNLFHVPNITEIILFYNGLDVPTRQILDSRGVVLIKTAEDAKTAILELAEYSQKWHNVTSRGRNTKTSDGLAAIQERGFGSLPSSAETNPSDQVKSISTTIEVDSNSILRIRSNQYVVSTGQNSTLLYKSRQTTVPFPSRLDNHYCEEEGNYGPKFTEAYGASHINNAIPRKDKDPGNFIILDMPEDVKVPLILGRPFLSTARAKIDVYKRKITLRVGEEKIIFKSVKPASSIIKRVYMLSLRERMELDLEVRLMGETLVLNRSLDHFSEDYIELNDLNEPFELRRNQGDDLMPTIEEGEVIKEFRTRDENLDTKNDDYPSYCDDDKKIHIDYAHNLKFSCMIGFEFSHVNFFPFLYVKMMSRKFHNSIMKNKMVYKGNNVVEALMNVPIFVGTFSVMIDFAVLEDMDAYRDNKIGDVIFGEPFLREVGIKTKRFKGIITLYNGDNEVTYQMVRSHQKFKHHTNEQYNKIPPLLKVSEKDKINEISHAYQKLKGFYKEVLNQGPDFI
ncbi:homeodomain-like protein [Tanacetum coccineum]